MIPNDTALLVIDIMNPFDFTHGETLAQHTSKIVDPINSLRRYCMKHQLPTIYINDHYELWKADYKEIYKKCHNKTSDPIMTPLQPMEDDYFLIKPKHSAFYGTALNTLLHHLSVKNLIITGIAGNICVLFTANDAYMREFNLMVPGDAIASVSEEDNHYALTMMKNVLKAKIDPTGGIL
ncbi:cysteine hydrolase [Rossellomorea vietnamensis]|uniref:isochorismatase family cysteine hydrolase n=1 Tax=Rossellomorea TaxID=2837508 RepID=UPI001CCE55CF|nr:MULTISPECIES: isochorismatase family cysteine hydrolase [Rossellomorea]MCA0151287.1 cysteine hydrolase [Rossellomorea vietnamensis]UTE77769.1 cysteine hydrolase [Rossellomorea sp. KS-H15a]